jgi:hypothetical protein
MAKKEDTPAKRAVIREWDVWAPKQPDADLRDGFLFFTYLQREHRELLDFKSQEINGKPSTDGYCGSGASKSSWAAAGFFLTSASGGITFRYGTEPPRAGARASIDE